MSPKALASISINVYNVSHDARGLHPEVSFGANIYNLTIILSVSFVLSIILFIYIGYVHLCKEHTVPTVFLVRSQDVINFSHNHLSLR